MRMPRILPALLVSSALMSPVPALAVDQGQLIGLGIGLGVGVLGKVLQNGGGLFGGGSDSGKKATRQPGAPGSQASKPSKRKPSGEAQEVVAIPAPMPTDHLGNLVLPVPRPPEFMAGFTDDGEYAADNPPQEAKINLWDDAPAESADVDAQGMVTNGSNAGGQGEPVVVVVGKPAADAGATDQAVEVSTAGSPPVAVSIGKPILTTAPAIPDDPQNINAASPEPVAVQIGTPTSSATNTSQEAPQAVSIGTPVSSGIAFASPNMATQAAPVSKNAGEAVIVPKIAPENAMAVKIGAMVSGKPAPVADNTPEVVEQPQAGQALEVKIGVPVGQGAKP